MKNEGGKETSGGGTSSWTMDQSDESEFLLSVPKTCRKMSKLTFIRKRIVVIRISSCSKPGYHYITS